MKKFFVTFGMGSLLRGYHAVFEARDEEIVRAFTNRKAKIPWASIYEQKPKGTKPLQSLPEILCYASAEHI